MLFSGYIEGYFGRLLSWEERDAILSQIEFKNLNTYFYCPKEDPYHRLDWKTPYPEKEKKSLKEFITKCDSKKIKEFQVPKRCGNSSKLKNLINYKPSINIKDGLNKTVTYYKKI